MHPSPKPVPGGKAAGAWADHSPPSGAEVKNAWSYTSILPILIHGAVLSQSTRNFTLPYLTSQSQLPSSRTTPCRLTATTYLIHSHLPSVFTGRLLHRHREDASCRGDGDPFDMEVSKLYIYIYIYIYRLTKPKEHTACGRTSLG
jgi:hypothetical protein